MDRKERDAAGVGPYARERETLVPLKTLGTWNVSEGEPDIRGWEVRTVSGRQLGTVQDLLIDTDAHEVVLLDVDLPGTDRHTFVPIRVVQIDRGRRVVLMDSADLPESDLARTETAAAVRDRAPDTGTVRYSRADREIVGERPRVADDASLVDTPADLPAVDRRHGERRRIDRMSTDL
jgi:sporulation protein YlmC with PRC-barrel domain